MKDTSNAKNLKTLTAERERWVTKMFWLGVEIAFIFAIPAALAVWVSRVLQREYAQIISLGGAFIFSWVLVILRYTYMTKRLRKLDEHIQILKEAETEK